MEKLSPRSRTLSVPYRQGDGRSEQGSFGSEEAQHPTFEALSQRQIAGQTDRSTDRGGSRFPRRDHPGSPGLHPTDNIGPWIERIQKASEDLMIVGHLPFLERLASFLLCGDESTRLILFRHGGIVCLVQKEDKAWAVGWIFVPEMAKE